MIVNNLVYLHFTPIFNIIDTVNLLLKEIASYINML